MPIRIKLFITTLLVSLIPFVFLLVLDPQFFHKLVQNNSAPFLILLFVSVISVTLASLFVALEFTLRIAELRQIAHQVQVGDLSPRVNVRSSDEIGEMGVSFNIMLDALQNQQGSLEKSVNEKSHELEERLKELESMNRIMVGRELKMIELKEEIKKLNKISDKT